MRYIFPVTDIRNYDRETLKEEIGAIGYNIKDVHIGNGILVLEFLAPLTEQEQQQLSMVVTAHAPKWYEWTDEQGLPYRMVVRCKEDVDKYTAMRIRQALGGIDPIQEQLKVLTEIVSSILAEIDQAASIGELKAKLGQSVSVNKAKLDKRTVFIEEGKQFKQTRGW